MLQWSHLKSREDTVLHNVGDPYQNKRFLFFFLKEEEMICEKEKH